MANKEASHWPITLTNGAIALLSIFLPLALVRILSPDQVGRYNIFFLYVMLLPGLFLTMGLTSGLYYWAGKYPEAKAEVRQSWVLLMAITLPLCALGLAGARWAAPLIKISPQDLQLVLLSIPLGIAASFFEDLMIARGDIWAGSLYASGFNLLRIAGLLAAGWWTRRLDPMFQVFLAVTALRAVAGWLLVFPGGEMRLIFSADKTKNVLRYALPVSIAGLSGLAVHYADQIILSFRLNPTQFAFYAMGCLSVPPLEIFETSVNRVLIPQLSQAFDGKEFSRAARLFSEAFSELSRFLIPATVGLILYADPIVRVLFTDRYLSAAVFLRVYALSYLLLAFPSSSISRARGDGRWILETSIYFAVLSAAATWLAAGRWSAMGALIAMLTSQVGMRVYAFFYVRRSLALPTSTFIPWKDLGIQTGLTLIATAISVALRPLFADSRAWFIVTGLLFTLIYFSGTYAVFLRRHRTAPGPLNILELAQTLCLGGLERMVYSLSRTFNQREEFKVLVATYDHPEGAPSLAPLFTTAGIPLAQWNKGKGFSPRSVFQLVRLAFSENTHILHAHDLGPLIYGSFAKLLSLGRIRLVLTLHTLLSVRESWKYRLYHRFFLRFPDCIVAVSPEIKNGLISLGIQPKRIEVIPNGVFFTPPGPADSATRIALRKKLQPRLSEDLYRARWILCLARLASGKGQDVVLNIWQALAPQVRAQAALFFVGQETETGYCETLRRSIAALPEARRIQIAGASEFPQEWLQSADIFISGSAWEGMPLAPLEAAGCGLPTLLSNIEGHQFLRSWASYFDPAKPDEGALKMNEIMETLRNDEDTRFFENRWQAAAPLRRLWDASVMRDAYAKTFESL